MIISEQHSSPDGLLKLIVQVDGSGDVSIGFEGYAWHTHGDILAELSGLPVAQAVRRFVDDILQGHSVIAVSRVRGTIQEVWLTEDATEAMRYRGEEEQIDFRCWDGQPFNAEPSAASNRRSARGSEVEPEAGGG